MEKYPRLTFRLDETLLTKVNRVSSLQNRSHGKVIREALEMYLNSPEASKKGKKHEKN